MQSLRVASKQLMHRPLMKTVDNPWLRDHLYEKDSIIRVGIREKRSHVDLRVVKPFTPFTNSVALLVDTVDPLPGLPRRLVLKLTDRRFGHRFMRQPWSPELEINFQKSLQIYVARHSSMPDLDRPKPSAFIRELVNWDSLMKSQRKEFAGYSRLTEAQSLGYVPKLYGRARIPMSPSSGSPHPSTEHIEGLLLEYIPGTVMDSINVGVDISLSAAEEISQKVLQLGRNLRRYGVTHGDIHRGNIILRSLSSDPVLIDWGFANCETADLPTLEERWKDLNVSQDFQFDFRWAVERNDDGLGSIWHKLSTPLSNRQWAQIAEEYGDHAKAWKMINKMVVNDTPMDELEDFYEEDESVDESEGLRWKVKPGVRTREREDPVPAT